MILSFTVLTCSLSLMSCIVIILPSTFVINHLILTLNLPLSSFLYNLHISISPTSYLSFFPNLLLTSVDTAWHLLFVHAMDPSGGYLVLLISILLSIIINVHFHLYYILQFHPPYNEQPTKRRVHDCGLFCKMIWTRAQEQKARAVFLRLRKHKPAQQLVGPFSRLFFFVPLIHSWTHAFVHRHRQRHRHTFVLSQTDTWSYTQACIFMYVWIRLLFSSLSLLR